MSDIPVEIKIWLPGHMPFVYRGTLVDFAATDSSDSLPHIGIGEGHLASITSGPLAVKINRRWWRFDKHRVPQIGGKNRG